MVRKSTLDKGLVDVVASALQPGTPNNHREDNSDEDLSGSPNERFQRAVDTLAHQEQPADEAFEALEQEIESNHEGTSGTELEVTRLDGSQIDAEVRDNIEDSVGAQDREILRTKQILDLIDARISRYAEMAAQVEKLRANAIRRRAEVESAYDAAQLARAMLEIKRSKRSA